jgi:hypothetical protein
MATINSSAVTKSTPASSKASSRSATVATSYTETPTGCDVVERRFQQIDAECSAGYYGADNLEIVSSDSTSVTFQVKHSFGAPLSPVAVWFKNAGKGKHDDFCWKSSDVLPSSLFSSEKFPLSSEKFTAKCVNKWATVTVSGSDRDDNSVFHQFVDVQEPRCQDKFDLPDFNPRKRCVWQFQVPCGCGVTGDRKLGEAESGSKRFWSL